MSLTAFSIWRGFCVSGRKLIYKLNISLYISFEKLTEMHNAYFILLPIIGEGSVFMLWSYKTLSDSIIYRYKLLQI